MKKFILAGIGIVAIGGLAWAGVFYFKNLRGVGPALRAPSGDIAELIRGEESENTTGMPLKLPPGFSIEVFAKNLPGARVMAIDTYGNMWVTQTSKGLISRLTVENGKVVKQEVMRKNLKKPHGLAVVPNSTYVFLYYAQENGIFRINPEGPDTKLLDLPEGDRHFTRTLGIGPDGKLYVAIGSNCDVCNEKDARHASIQVVDIENKKLIPYAKGLRNSVFFTWDYVHGRMWGTEMGRDLLGDELPPDEINIIEQGKNYGWPICYGKNIHDSVFDKNTYIRNPCMEPFEIPSYIDLPAHSAPLGLAFIPEEGWPEEYWYDLLVAFHGSWNRSEPTGYKIARIKLDAQGNPPAGGEGVEDFISGWLQKDGTALGRPVDILVQPGGTMYISDDKAGVIYKVTRNHL